MVVGMKACRLTSMLPGRRYQGMQTKTNMLHGRRYEAMQTKMSMLPGGRYQGMQTKTPVCLVVGIKAC